MKIIFPAVIALIGSLWFAVKVGGTLLVLPAFIGCLILLGFLTLLAVPIFARPSTSTATAGWYWLAALWLIPIAGTVLGSPIAKWRSCAARQFPSVVSPRLERFHAENGRYPASLADIAYYDLRRHLLRYSATTDSYEFQVSDPAHLFTIYTYSSDNPSWVITHD